MERTGPDRRVRADFDVSGLRFCATLIQRLSATPWRMDTPTYINHRGDNDIVKGAVPNTPWAPSLREAMAGFARVEEEELIDALLSDLSEMPPISV